MRGSCRAVLLAAFLGFGASPPLAFADRALPSWEAHRASRDLAIAAEAWARGEVRIAEAAAASAVAADPQRAEAWALLARARLGLGRFEAASEAAVPLAQLASQDVEAALLRGRIAVELGDAGAARAAYGHAAEIAPMDPRPALGEALVAARLNGDMAAMAAHLRIARSIDPAEPSPSLPLRAAWAPLAEDESFLAALGAILQEAAPPE